MIKTFNSMRNIEKNFVGGKMKRTIMKTESIINDLIDKGHSVGEILDVLKTLNMKDFIQCEHCKKKINTALNEKFIRCNCGIFTKIDN